MNDVTETPTKRSLLPCCVHAFALSALIFSHLLSNAAIALFVARPCTLGTQGEDWMSWHGMGCFFVGLVTLAALRWNEAKPRRDIAFATAVIHGVEPSPWFCRSE